MPMQRRSSWNSRFRNLMPIVDAVVIDYCELSFSEIIIVLHSFLPLDISSFNVRFIALTFFRANGRRTAC